MKYVYMVTSLLVACTSTMPRAEVAAMKDCQNQAGDKAQQLVDQLCPGAKPGCEGFGIAIDLLNKELMKCDGAD